MFYVMFNVMIRFVNPVMISPMLEAVNPEVSPGRMP
ncbi:hypothetical protein SNOG_06901 [Parastagonospora nodorum SN15]|uniref:Uncharacterized protein n=1 Tax=Phaeosphaeria nodorum (strain SN15 / ATCC MYA-4574 / FGSC 10173) TaxID=321614 RepID=Q0UMW3_PHANO|nr:hypothetical protein SNOG_06901 [Parastagonospora nodorum SN15]EAT85552.1 hypothetical protein SNOG_06901 [Parastagonospora nodorum SN15]